MKSKTEILASNPNLISYRVMLHEDKGDRFQIAFDCYAEDDDQAAAQALSAYPAGEVISTTPFAGNDEVAKRVLPKKFFLTTYRLEVLSKDKPAVGLSLDRIAYHSGVGEFSSNQLDDGGVELTLAQCDLCHARHLAGALGGSDPSVFQLDNLKPQKAVSTPYNIDWALLRKQKDGLVYMANEEERLTSEIEILDGVIAMLDHIQDDAVAHGRATELEVFGPDWVVYSANESALSSDGAGFWSNISGWTTSGGADHFTDCEKQAMHLPMSTGGDAKWVTWPEIVRHYGEYSDRGAECESGSDALSDVTEQLS